MDPTITSLGIPTGVAGWDLLQNKTAASYPALTSDPVVTQAISYFEKNAPKATTAAALMADPQLQDFVLTAYGLTSESGYTSLMTKVLNSNTANPSSFANELSNPAFAQIASAFNYGGTTAAPAKATASSATVDVSGLYAGSNFGSFSGTFGGTTISNVNLSGATTWQGLANTLQSAFQKADGGRTDITVKLDGPNLVFSDASGRGTAAGFTWTANAANTGTAPVASSPTAQTVAVSNLSSGSNFGTFSGTFGGTTVSNVDLTSATTLQGMATTLQTALQAADGGQNNITVTTNGSNLVFSNTNGDETASGFAWTANSANTAGNPTAASATQMTTVAGETAAQAAGGAVPAVASTAELALGLSGLTSTSNFSKFSGTFGGVSLSNVDLTGVSTAQGMASTLQAAFRAADGNSSNISVKLNGLNLEFSDAAGNGTASGFTWTANPANTGQAPNAPTLDNLVTGSPAIAGAGAAATASTAEVYVSGLGAGSTLTSFSGSFAGLSVSNVNLTKATTMTGLASTLQSALRAADGNSKSISVTANGLYLEFSDSAGRGSASGFTWAPNTAGTAPSVASPDNVVAGVAATPAAGAAATPSKATIQVNALAAGNNFKQFTGTFGGVTVMNLDLTGVTTWTGLASALQTGFRAADTAQSKVLGQVTVAQNNISVTASGDSLTFTDSKGRGTAVGFSFTANPLDNTVGAPTVGYPTNKVAGTPASTAAAASSGPQITNKTFIQTVVQKYLEAQFETVIGDQSQPLQEARYAQKTLPSVTNWYSVIASPPLAAVVQTVLGLPSSFGAIDVDQQVRVLSSRLNIKDFQNPTKLNALLTQFVAMSGNTSQVSAAGAANQVLSATPNSSGLINLSSNGLSSGSMSALVLG